LTDLLAAAGISLRALDTIEDADEFDRVLSLVWEIEPGSGFMDTAIVRALAHAGNYAFLASRDGETVGATLGFTGLHDGKIVLHSHVTGVRTDLQHASIGFALKMHQRSWALERGIETIFWTYDPMMARNAYFNIMKLGGTGVAYEPNFYGPFRRGIYARPEGDAMFVRWDLTRPGPRPEPNLEGAVLVQIPEDVRALRRDTPDEALARQHRVRDEIRPLLEQGYAITGFTKDSRYVLTRGRP
jgi:predicted GNAT superfamily acetyltransferase